MRTFVPALDWLKAYERPWFGADLVAGLTTAAIVIPKAMAYATIAGLPLQVGLYTAFVPMVIYALLGTSRMLSVSTTTTIAILCGAELGDIARTQPDVSLATATATLTMLVGAILLGARLLRLGFLANFISDPVLTGFKAGIGLVIVVDQAPKLLGIHIDKDGFFTDVVSIAAHVPQTSLATFAIAIATFVVIGVCEKFIPRAPAPLVALGGAITASVLLALQSHGVSIVGAIPSGFPSLSLPDTKLLDELWAPAAGIALMSFTETIAAGRAFAHREDPRTDSNQELVAIGAGNVIGGLFGAMPSGGGTSQTNVNLGAGARTQVAELVTAATAVAAMLFLSPVLAPMPNAALAAVVIAYSVGLISPAEISAIRDIRTLEFRWAIAAFAGVVLLGTLKGILAAVVLSMVSLMQIANNPPLYILGRKPGTNVFRPRDPDKPGDETYPGLLIVRTLGRMYFANAPIIAEKIRVLVNQEKPKVLAIDCGAIPGLEFTALKMLVDSDQTLRDNGVELWLIALNPEALDLIRRTPLAESMGRDRMFFTVEDAVAAYQKRMVA